MPSVWKNIVNTSMNQIIRNKISVDDGYEIIHSHFKFPKITILDIM